MLYSVPVRICPYTAQHPLQRMTLSHQGRQLALLYNPNGTWTAMTADRVITQNDPELNLFGNVEISGYVLAVSQDGTRLDVLSPEYFELACRGEEIV